MTKLYIAKLYVDQLKEKDNRVALWSKCYTRKQYAYNWARKKFNEYYNIGLEDVTVIVEEVLIGWGAEVETKISRFHA